MANIKSQKKRILTNEKRRVKNKDSKTALKTYIKRFQEAVEGDDAAATEAAFRKASRQLDKAASKGVIHANAAANRKSALSKAFHAASQSK